MKNTKEEPSNKLYTISRKMFHKLMILSRYFVLILNCPIFLLILVNWGDFFSVGDTKFMAVMLKGPWIWNKRWNIQICVQKLAKEGQNFYVQAINYQLPLDFQFSDIENTEMERKRKQIYFVSDIIYDGDEILKFCWTVLNMSVDFWVTETEVRPLLAPSIVGVL